MERKCSTREASGIRNLNGRRRRWGTRVRMVRDGREAVKREQWRAGTQGAGMEDMGNAYSYEIKYLENGEGTPFLMRGELAESLDENGVRTVREFGVEGGTLRKETRKYFGEEEFPTYEVEEIDAVHGTVLYRGEWLRDGDVELGFERAGYDEKNRLRWRECSDGSGETNHYSCCRLLWKRDREGRRVLRSASTGRDHLYYAMEDVWLGEASTNGEHRVTQYFYDGLGRETNRVTYASGAAGAAIDPRDSEGRECARVRTVYPDGGSGHSVERDERGKVIERRSGFVEGGMEEEEIVYTNGVEVMRTVTGRAFGGGTVVRKEWGGKWAEDERRVGYAGDGKRVEYAVRRSSDYGTVTNSVTRYDLLGRLERVETPLGVTEYTYAGAGKRVARQTVTSGEVVRSAEYIYNGVGEEVGIVQDGITRRADAEYEVGESNMVWKVTTERAYGEATNGCVMVRERLTGLSDDCRAETIRVDLMTGRVARTVRYVDVESGVEVERVEDSGADVVETGKSFGLEVERVSSAGTELKEYDGLGRVVAEMRVEEGGVERRVRAMEYLPSGDLAAVHMYTNGSGVATTRYGYDVMGNCVRQTDAIGGETCREYDAAGNLVCEWGATYPVRQEYDTQGRRIMLGTTRDGAEWDVTRWEYDDATGLCVAKIYADGTREEYTYTADGLPLRTAYASGRWIENLYNGRRKVAGTVSSDGEENTAIGRDEFGRETGETNGVAAVTYMRADGGVATNESWTIGGETLALVREIDGVGRLGFNNGMRLEYGDGGKLTGMSNELAVVKYIYTADGMDGGYTIALSNGKEFARRVMRDEYRRELATGVVSTVNGIEAERVEYGYDAMGRPVRRGGDVFGYNGRGEIVRSVIDGEEMGYSYDDIGNCLRREYAGGETNVFAANGLNQYTMLRGGGTGGGEICFEYDADGNLIFDGTHTYAYDSLNRLKSVASNGVALATNYYDAKSRRVKKETAEATIVYFYDDWNLIEERVAYANGTTKIYKYYWGKDLSGTLQGAGGIGGLLYLTIDGAVYVPCYDNNGNVTKYLDSDGNVAAAYGYDAFGRTVVESGAMAGVFRLRFSTKYFDGETGLYYYGYRFYHTGLMRWLNRDPIGEVGGLNIYSFCKNNGIFKSDNMGLLVIVHHQYGEAPPMGWLDPRDKGLTLAIFRVINVKPVHYDSGKIRFSVSVKPKQSRIDVYYRITATLATIRDELDHINCNIAYDRALDEYLKVVQAIYDCATEAYKKQNEASDILEAAAAECRACNQRLDEPGGPHGH